MPPVPSVAFGTPQIDVENGNDIVAMVVDSARWETDRVVECSVVFRKESAYDAASGNVDLEATAVLLANNSLHYGRSTDVERFCVAYDDGGNSPIGIGFGSFGAPQSWAGGLGTWIEIPRFVPTIGGRRIVTFKDDMPLAPSVDARVFSHKSKYWFPWNGLEEAEDGTRRVYVSTPNHLFDVVNRNSAMSHIDQKYLSRSFQQLIELPSAAHGSAEDVARTFSDESNPEVRRAVQIAAQLLFRRHWLF